MMTFIVKMFCLLALSLTFLDTAAPAYVRILPQDCQDIYRSGVTRSGVNTIYPLDSSPVAVYCMIDWTVFQRRTDGSVNFYRGWEQYRNGFGNKSGEYWLGLENLSQMTQNKVYELQVDLEDHDGSKVSALYKTFSVGSKTNGYVLQVGSFINQGAGDAMTYHNGQRFSTYDNEQNPYNCSTRHLGAFWYNNCFHTNPNGIYLGRQDGTHLAIGDAWAIWKGLDYGLKSITMKIRPAS